jgi:hypothetical protein
MLLHLAADGLGQLLLAQVARRLGHHHLDLLASSPRRRRRSPARRRPGSSPNLSRQLIGSRIAKQNLISAAAFGRARSSLILLADALGVVAPAAN